MSDIMKQVARLCKTHNLDKRLLTINPYDTNLTQEEKALVFSTCRTCPWYLYLIIKTVPNTMRLVKPTVVTGNVYQVVLEETAFKGVLLKVLMESDIQTTALNNPHIRAWLFDSGDMAILLTDTESRKGLKLFIKTDKVVITRNGGELVESDYTPLEVATLFHCSWVP